MSNKQKREIFVAGCKAGRTIDSNWCLDRAKAKYPTRTLRVTKPREMVIGKEGAVSLYRVHDGVLETRLGEENWIPSNNQISYFDLKKLTELWTNPTVTKQVEDDDDCD